MTMDVRERATSHDFDFWMGRWNVRNRRLVRRLAGSDEWDEFESKVAARPLPGGLGNEDVYCTEYGGGFIGMSFRFYDPETDAVVDLLGRQPAAGIARTAGDRFLLGRHGDLRGRRHVRRSAHPGAVHLVGRHDVDAALGASVLGRRRRDVGDELGDGVHARRRPVVSALEQSATVEGVDPGYRHIAKVAVPQPSLMLGDALLKWYDIAPSDTPVPLAIRALARRCLRDASKAGTLGVEDGLGFVILHRCGGDFYFLLVSTWRNENELWETVWAKRDESDVFFNPWPSDGTHRPRSACGSSVRSRTSGMRGHDSSARRATRRPGAPTSATRTSARSDEHGHAHGGAALCASLRRLVARADRRHRQPGSDGERGRGRARARWRTSRRDRRGSERADRSARRASAARAVARPRRGRRDCRRRALDRSAGSCGVRRRRPRPGGTSGWRVPARGRPERDRSRDEPRARRRARSGGRARSSTGRSPGRRRGRQARRASTSPASAQPKRQRFRSRVSSASSSAPRSARRPP